MKKHVIILVISALAIVFGICYLIFQKDDQLSNEEERAFAIKNIGEIDQIHLANTNGDEVTLTKNESNRWLVNNQFLAREQRIKLLLETAKNLQVQQKVPKAKQARILKNLAINNIIAEFYSDGEIVKTYYVGKSDGKGTGTYMLLKNPSTGKNASTPYLTYLLGFQGYLTPRYEPHPKTWRDLNLLYFPKLAIQKIELTYPQNPSKNWSLKLQNEKYVLKNNNSEIAVDNNAIKRYLLNYKNINAERILPKSDSLKQQLKSKKPWFILSVTNLLGKENKIIGYKKEMPKGSKNAIGLPLLYDPDRFYGICFNNELCYLQYYVFDPLIVDYNIFQK